MNEAPEFDPERDLALSRLIRAPRSTVWRAWTDPERLARWWIPAPFTVRIDRLDPVAGGAFVTRMSEDGSLFTPHLDAIFLAAEPERRLVFSNGLDSGWRPARPFPVAMTAHIAFGEHAEGTDYRVIVRHGSEADRDKHERLGFFDGWGSVTDALAALSEAEA
ncbi:MAG: polyketide cyclase [Candidatus Leucobacter sulfamidivorax]|jgi:uncharacterized protein YndB with AHSA1/START domain|nr:polyketide cyclase [Candidatus Leucobacter sulfamidivorax]